MMGLLIVLGILIGCGLVLQSRASRGKPKPYKYRPMQLIVGTPGTGKSYTLTYRAIESLAHGRHVRINFGLRPDRVFVALRLRYGLTEADARAAIDRISYFRTWEDYVDAYDLDAYIDEAQDVYRSTDWNIVPPEFITWNAQHRHRLCRVMLAAHRYGSIHNYVRDGLIANIYLSKPASWLIRLGRKATGNNHPLLTMREIKSEEEETLPTPSKRGGLFSRIARGYSIPLDPVIANCYDHVGGVFMSPLDLQRRATGKGPVLELSNRQGQAQISAPVDGLPSLSLDELLEERRGGVPFVKLRDRWDLLRLAPKLPAFA